MTVERHEEQLRKVNITRGAWGVMARTMDKIPQASLLTIVLNSALMEKFGLDLQFATEGGIQGMHKDTRIDLTNLSSSRNIGLHNEAFWPDHPYNQGNGLSEVFDSYEHMLHLVFDEGFSAENREHKAGELLEIPQDEATSEKVWEILKDVLIATQDRAFAEKVVGKIVNHNGSSRVFIRGLTDEEIVERYVEPPLE